MRHTIWERLVRADDRVGDVALDAILAIAVAAVMTEILRSVLSLL